LYYIFGNSLNSALASDSPVERGAPLQEGSRTNITEIFKNTKRAKLQNENRKDNKWTTNENNTAELCDRTLERGGVRVKGPRCKIHKFYSVMRRQCYELDDLGASEVKRFVNICVVLEMALAWEPPKSCVLNIQ